MTQINLREYSPAECHLSQADRDTLLRHAETLGVTVEPILGGGHRLTAGAKVGAVEIDGLSVLIEPKIPIPQILSLACYATGVITPQEKWPFNFDLSEALPDMLALALASAARSAFARGLLHGYRTKEEALQTVRGRIRLEQQIRRRFGMMLPVDVIYDEFTEDVLANRLVKAAAERLGRMRLRSQKARSQLGAVAATLENVAHVEFTPSEVPEVRFDRLNEHYRQAVGLSRLILRHNAFESRRGNVRSCGFLMNMNTLFQEFVIVALRESLGVSERMLRSERNIPEIPFDEAETVELKPDLSWWDGQACTFVGDFKYKKLTGRSVPKSDLYQLLAYTTALDLPGGLLIYAKSERVKSASYRVHHSGKRLDVAALDLSGTLQDVLRRVDLLANDVRELRDEARASTQVPA